MFILLDHIRKHILRHNMEKKKKQYKFEKDIFG